jgi:TIR domain
MADTRSFKVFISYAHRDALWASKFADELEAHGVHAWFAEREIALGDRVSDKVEQAFREAPVVAFLLSPDYVTSPSSAFELGAAVGGNKKIIPILTHEASNLSLPPLLRDRQLLQEPSPEAAGKRVAEVVEHLSHQIPAEAE